MTDLACGTYQEYGPAMHVEKLNKGEAMSTRVPISAVVTFVFCVVGSLLLGYIAYGKDIFESHLIYFQFVGFGVLCGVLVVVAQYVGTRATLLVGLVAYPVLLSCDGANTGALFVRDAVGVAGLVVAVLVGFWNNRLLPRLVLGKFVVWGATFGVVHLIMFAILSFVNGRPFDLGMAMVSMRIGTLLGAGIGLGYEVSELLNAKLGLRVPK